MIFETPPDDPAELLPEKRHLVVVPDDFPPVFADSTALMRLRRRSDIETVVHTSQPRNEADLIERITNAETVLSIRSSTPFNHSVIEAAPSLQHLAIWGTAIDNISMDAARRAGVAVTHTPNTATDAVAEHALALALTLAHRLHELDQRVRGGEWPGVRITQLAGKTAGVIGAGAVGLRFAELAHGIGMDVLICPMQLHGEVTRNEAFPAWSQLTGLDELLEAADVVSLHGRLSPSTDHLIDLSRLEQMRPNALLVNTARGRLVSEQDLTVALTNDTIAGAALDVFEHEPLSHNSPLRSLSNVILSPHAAAATNEALSAGLNAAADNVMGFLDGREVPRVDR